MNKLKTIWSTITGSISSIIPLFFACCKSGACIGVCASPVASLLGISSASIAASPMMQSLVPVLIAFSAVSFTISYYNLYVLPKYATSCASDCACDTTNTSKDRWAKIIFWVGLIASIGFFTFFEYEKYKVNTTPIKTTQTTSTCGESDTTKTCCAEGETCE